MSGIITTVIIIMGITIRVTDNGKTLGLRNPGKAPGFFMSCMRRRPDCMRWRDEL
jgi:hypothetical protein